MTVGERLKKVRLDRGMTQKQVAEACGMADSAIRKYESGKIIPKFETLQRIAAALNIGVFYLLDETEKKAFDAGVTAGIRSVEIENRDFEGYSFSETEHSLVDAFSQLNSDGQQKAVERVEELTEIPRYRRQDATSQPPEGKDTPTAEDPTDGE